jgi:hypothetical protein
MASMAKLNNQRVGIMANKIKALGHPLWDIHGISGMGWHFFFFGIAIV